jgi:outer membrane protein OmpA-like peptidoglycan-associated protein
MVRAARRGGRFGVTLLAVCALAVAATGCSSTKKAPGEATAPKQSGGKDTKKAPEIAKVERRSGTFPKLSTVPNRPKVTSQQDRLVIEEGLMSDRERARHTEALPPWAEPKTSEGAPPGAAPSNESVQLVTVAGTKLATIRFPTGSARLPIGAEGLMRQIAKLQKRTGAKVVAVGHTSRRKRSNKPDVDKTAKNRLSTARAKAVTSMLARMGIAADRLQAIARGDTEPADAHRPFLNRRVDIFIQR